MNTDRTGIPRADDREPLQQPIDDSDATRDQNNVMARIRERFGVGPV